MVVHQEDVDARFHISVLEGIVEQYHIHILCLFVRLQSLYSSDSLGVYCHIDVGELADEVFHMRSLTRPTYRDVAYGYDGQAESLASLDAYIEEPVAKADCHTV